MWVEHGKVEGPLELSEELQLHGMVTGAMTVLKGGRLHLNGTCCQGLLVESGGWVELNGTVTGDVVNRGGVLLVRGVVTGSLRTEAGETSVSRDAKVIGGIYD